MEICKNPDCGQSYDPQDTKAKGIQAGCCSLHCSAFVAPPDDDDAS